MKPLSLLFGMFGYRRTPAAEIDGGMAEYTFEQFQTLPPQNVLVGRGFLYHADPLLAEQDLFVFAPATPPFDITKVPVGDPSLEEALIQEAMLL